MKQIIYSNEQIIIKSLKKAMKRLRMECITTLIGLLYIFNIIKYINI